MSDGDMHLGRDLRDLLADAFGPRRRKATIILLVAPFLFVTWKLFGSPEYYAGTIAPWLGVAGGAGGTAGLSSSVAAEGAVYSFTSCFLLLAVIPVLIVKLGFRERLADYGVQLGNRKRTLRTILMLGPAFVLGGYIASQDPELAGRFPINPQAGVSAGAFALHAATYLLFYLGWEFYFRGFLQFGLRHALGDVHTVLVQVLASTLSHIGDPASEVYGAIFGGMLWGMLAFRTRSLLSGLVQHYLLGVSLDWFVAGLGIGD
jgi:membrane protease YdiL (CAAX protease family)